MPAVFKEQSPHFGSYLDQNQGSRLGSIQAEGRRPELLIVLESSPKEKSLGVIPAEIN